MENKIYTPLGVQLRIIESKALASEIEKELLVPDPDSFIIPSEENKVNENSPRNDGRGSNKHYSKDSKETKV